MDNYLLTVCQPLLLGTHCTKQALTPYICIDYVANVQNDTIPMEWNLAISRKISNAFTLFTKQCHFWDFILQTQRPCMHTI